jgi:hypothetical protein
MSFKKEEEEEYNSNNKEIFKRLIYKVLLNGNPLIVVIDIKADSNYISILTIICL